MPLDKKKLVIITVAVVVIVALIVIAVLRNPASKTGTPTNTRGTGTTTVSATRTDMPQNVSVPSVSSTNVPANVAKPTVVAPASPNTTASYRSFNIEAKNNTFSPDTIIIKAGDVANIEITAVDKNYDFTQPDLGFNQIPIPKGTTKRIQFTVPVATKLTFYCSACGGIKSSAVGYVVSTQ